MTIYNFYIYNRKGECIYYREWNRSKQSGLPMEQEYKQMFGCIVEMKSFINKVSPNDLMKDDYFSFKTNKYKMNYYETASGIKFVLNTDINVGNIRDLLHQLYENVVVQYVVRNPLSNLLEPIKSDLFQEKLDEYVKNTQIFA